MADVSAELNPILVRNIQNKRHDICNEVTITFLSRFTVYLTAVNEGIYTEKLPTTQFGVLGVGSESMPNVDIFSHSWIY